MASSLTFEGDQVEVFQLRVKVDDDDNGGATTNNDDGDSGHENDHVIQIILNTLLPPPADEESMFYGSEYYSRLLHPSWPNSLSSGRHTDRLTPRYPTPNDAGIARCRLTYLFAADGARDIPRDTRDTGMMLTGTGHTLPARATEHTTKHIAGRGDEPPAKGSSRYAKYAKAKEEGSVGRLAGDGPSTGHMSSDLIRVIG